MCKISDFGISKRTDDVNEQAVLTAMQGTVFWMAPEVVNTGKRGYNAKVDIWSVGCVVLEMWAGERPWRKEEAMAVIVKVRSYARSSLEWRLKPGTIVVSSKTSASDPVWYHALCVGGRL